MQKLKLIPAPRLYVTAEVFADLSSRLHSPFLREEAERVLRDADRLLRAPPLKEGSGPSYQETTRAIDSHLQCLTCAWVLTHEPRYRAAALRHLANVAAFHQISCEARITTPPDAELPFCLSYGELSATVGLMYDLFRPELTDDEQGVFFAMLDRHLMRAAVKAVENPPWWANKEWSNWNGVCAGGMGILALAFHDDAADAPRLIPFVEESLGAYFSSFVKNDGGCPEGTGYWNYGMNYAVRYLLSWERATGRRHPAFRIRQLGRSLFFPLDFTGISFGDNDGWGPTAFFFLMARRLRQPAAALRAAVPLMASPHKFRRRDRRTATGDLLYAADAIPTAEQIERLRKEHEQRPAPVARIYRGMDWAALADDDAFPRLRMAVRGGSSAIAGHGMVDLLSIRCRVDGALMITDQQDGAYMATTFSGRGHEIYGRSPASKSTLFVDGLGGAANASCDRTEVVRGGGILGIRVDGSHAFLPRWKNVFIGRLVLLVENAGWLVIDRVRGADAADTHWLESRFHVPAGRRRGQNWVEIENGAARLQMTFASLVGGVLRKSYGMPSQPAVQPTLVFRWMSAVAAADQLHVTALNPGDAPLQIAIHPGPRDVYSIAVTGSDRKVRTLRVSARLTLSSGANDT